MKLLETFPLPLNVMIVGYKLNSILNSTKHLSEDETKSVPGRLVKLESRDRRLYVRKCIVTVVSPYLLES